MDNIQGNVSTIGVMIWTVLCPYISQYVSQDVFLAIFGLLIVLWSAYNPNTFEWLGNGIKKTVVDGEEPVLNDEYEVGDDSDGC